MFKSVAFFAQVSVILSLLTLLGSPAARSEPQSGMRIAVIPKSVDIGYFQGWNEGAQRACRELKEVKCDFIGPKGWGRDWAQIQLEIIDAIVARKKAPLKPSTEMPSNPPSKPKPTQKPYPQYRSLAAPLTSPTMQGVQAVDIRAQYDAIVLSAADQTALAPALKRAKAAGICVVTSDADVADITTRAASVLPASAQRIGEAEVDWIAQEIGGKGKIAILSAAATAANQNAWIDFMKAYLPTKYPSIELVGVYYGDDDTSKSAQQYNQILTEHPDIAGIISPTTVGIRAAAQEKKSKGGSVAITGLGLPSEMKDFVLGGQVTKFGLWNPIDLGYVGTYAAAECASNGNKVPKSFKAGGKTYTQGDKGVIFLGDPATFDKSNIAKFAAIY